MTSLVWLSDRETVHRDGIFAGKMVKLLTLIAIVAFANFFQKAECFADERDGLLDALSNEYLDEDELLKSLDASSRTRFDDINPSLLSDEKLLEFLNDNDDNLDDADVDDILAYFHIFEELKFFPSTDERNRIKVANFLKKYQQELHKNRRKSAIANWNKETNLTHHNIEVSKKISLELSAWSKKKRLEAKKFSKNGLNYVQNRMLKFILESASLNEVNLRKEKLTLESKISEVYSKAVVCKKSTDKCYHFEPGLNKLFRVSRDYDELLWAWKGWRDAIGPKIRKDWYKAEMLLNKGAAEHGYKDIGHYIRHSYEDPQFESEIDKLWEKLEPFYKQLHAYVRYKLHKQYGERVSLTKPIPAHILGGMWAMKWDSLLDLVEPYPETGGFEVTKGMKEKNYTVHQMFVLADEFYRSIGLPPMTPQFWNYSMFERPKDNRSVVCYASAHNLEGDDVRVKMCAAVNAEYLYVVHHEMGHCQYYLSYNRHQPEIFQTGANHGFHEAIGDTAALSVISPTHLNKLGILKEGTMTAEQTKQKDLNFLMQKALGKLAFFPFAITMAKWSWNVARGVIPKTELNAAWWRYKKRYQGLEPPVARSERDFDPGSKYHIANFVPYIRYFVSHILQFQFYEAMCDLADHKGPLHRCDFAGSKKAGGKFKKMLEMGQSKPWPNALYELTGTRKMKVDSVIRYFSPLLKWLQAENKRLGVKIGWD